MLFFLKKLIVATVLPPTGLLLLIVVGLVIIRRRLLYGRLLIVASTATLLMMSIPAVSNFLQRSVQVYPPVTVDALRLAQVIVVLGGGIYAEAPEYGGTDTSNTATLTRIRYAAYLQRRSRLPILVTGGAPNGGTAEAQVMRDGLENEFQVPVRWLETQSLVTAENASFSKAVLAEAGVTKIALVTDATHMARAKLEFENVGFIVLPAPTLFATDSWGFDLWLPSARALELSNYAIREWLALAFRKIR